MRKSQDCATELQYLPMKENGGDLETPSGIHGVEGSPASDGGKSSNSPGSRVDLMNKQPDVFTIKIHDAGYGRCQVDKNSVDRHSVEQNSTKGGAHSMNGTRTSLLNLNPLLLSGRSS